MLTVEFEDNSTVITALDTTGKHEDVQMILDAKEVWVRQWNPNTNLYDLVVITHKQFDALLAAQSLPEGAYQFKKKKGR
jgi:hypothetical protein